MARDIIDDRFIGALHVRSLTRAGFDHDPVTEHTAIQAGTLEALMAGGYEGDTTLDEVLRLGDLGIGTIQQLDGELVILDGTAWAVGSNGMVREVHGSTFTPFAVVTHFAPEVTRTVQGPFSFGQLAQVLDDAAPPDAPVIAIRIDGEFADLSLRSVEKQEPPYKPLREVVAHQTEWSVASATGTLVGFRFPDATAGLEVPGYHLHFLSDDRSIGGHVMAATLLGGRLAIDPCHELHVELPDGVSLGTPGSADRAEIARLEGGAGWAGS
jgi:acetolactate decarboxylase